MGEGYPEEADNSDPTATPAEAYAVAASLRLEEYILVGYIIAGISGKRTVMPVLPRCGPVILYKPISMTDPLKANVLTPQKPVGVVDNVRLLICFTVPWEKVTKKGGFGVNTGSMLQSGSVTE